MWWYSYVDTAFLLLYAIAVLSGRDSDSYKLFVAYCLSCAYAYSYLFDAMTGWQNHTIQAIIFTVCAGFIRSQSVIKSILPLVMLHSAMAYNQSIERTTALDSHWAECWLISNLIIISLLFIQSSKRAFSHVRSRKPVKG